MSEIELNTGLDDAGRQNCLEPQPRAAAGGADGHPIHVALHEHGVAIQGVEEIDSGLQPQRLTANVFENRKTIWFSRSPYIVLGSTRAIVAAAAEDRLRPRDGAICALAKVALAVTSGPGMPWNVAASWMSHA
jgi:hypothetical protein